MLKKSHHFLTLWPWPLTYDLEKFIRSGHYHYQCVYQIWEQSIPWFLSYRVNTIAGGGRLWRKTITSPDPSDTGDIKSVITLTKWFLTLTKLEQLERLHSENTAPWLSILLIHVRSQVKTRQSQSYKFEKFAKNSNFGILLFLTTWNQFTLPPSTSLKQGDIIIKWQRSEGHFMRVSLHIWMKLKQISHIFSIWIIKWNKIWKLCY